jgi:serine/threonine-protein kinase RsbW
MRHEMDANIQLTIDSRLDNTALAGLAVRGIAQGFGLDEAEAYLLELAVVEAVSNVIRHAYGGRSGNPVDISVTVTPQGMIMDIRDRGVALDPGVLDRAKEFQEPEGISDLPEGGMGLSIIKQVMDKVTYASRDGINTLSMAKALKLAPPREAALGA